MELPFTIVFEPPSQSELRALLRMRGCWVAGLIVALTIGIAYVLAHVAHADAVATGAGVPLALSSQPSGAVVWLDGQERGVTPIDVRVGPGVHSVLMKARDAVDSPYTLEVGNDGAGLEAVLWRRQPLITRLRAALPGAALADVRLLEDGQIGLTIGLATGRQLQAWRLEPRMGALEPALTNVAGPRLAFAPTGLKVAYIGSEVGPPPPWSSSFEPPDGAVSVLWLVAASVAAAPTAAWRAPLEQGERLVDVSWSPLLDRLLVVSSQALPGGATRSRAWFVDADGQHAQPMLSLPSEIVPGSAVWSPDGRGVVFMAHAAEVNALCLLRSDGGFHYVADLASSTTPPLPYPPAAWSADGRRLVFVAPHQRPPGAALGWFQPDPQRAVYMSNLDESTPRVVGDTDVDMAVWREDGSLLGLGRSGADGALSLRLLSSTGSTARQLLELPLRPANPYAVVWDVWGARLLVASQITGGGADFWLARLAVEGDA